MVAVPTINPVTRPEEFTDAFEWLLLQTPPDTVLANCVVVPTATVVIPVIAGTTGMVFTKTEVMADTAEQPTELVTVTL